MLSPWRDHKDCFPGKLSTDGTAQILILRTDLKISIILFTLTETKKYL